MSPSVKPIPDGYPRVTPYLFTNRASAAIDFYTKVFGATERMRMAEPNGTIGHAELTIGDSVIMLADEHPDRGVLGPRAIGGTPVMISIYVEDVDKTIDQAVTSGATILHPIADQFYGDRSGTIEDPFGHHWNVATHVEDIAPEEMARRAAAAADGGG